MNENIGGVGAAVQRWCILRTSAGRTLPLARSLAGAGFEVWTPSHTVRVRRPRSTRRVDRDMSIVPTFVFARADQALDLIREAARELSAHPKFSVFRHRGRVPLIADHELERLRLAEQRARRRQPKPAVQALPVGAKVTSGKAGLQGLTGTVEHSDERKTLVYFGGWLKVSIDTFLVEPVAL